MNVACPTCATIYRIDPAKVPGAGVRARCSVCAAVFPVSSNGTSPGPVAAPPSAPVVERGIVPAAPLSPPPAPPVAAPPVRPPVGAPPAGGRPAIPTGLRPSGMFAPPLAPTAPVAPLRPSAPVVPPRPAAAPVAPMTPAAPPRAPAASPLPPTPRPVGAAPGRAMNPFMSQDPSQKARRLARALISDLVVYGTARRDEALRNGTLKASFGEEIKKSWEEFVDQVGKEMAESTTYFNDALNEILAGGQKIF